MTGIGAPSSTRPFPVAQLPQGATYTDLSSAGSFYILSGTTWTAVSGGGGGAVSSVNGQTGTVVITQTDVGLGNVSNLAPASYPVSTAQQTALDLKAPLSSPAFTNTPTVPTAAAGTNTTQAASTAFVTTAVAAGPGADGWTPGEAWTFVSTSTFSVASDVTLKYSKGNLIKLTQTTVKYFYVIGVGAFSAGTTIITVTGGSDYALANAAITLPFFSNGVEANGFPQWFNWIPSYTGFSVNPTPVFNRFCIVGHQITCVIRQVGTGTGSGTTFFISLPVTAASVGVSYFWSGFGIAFENSSLVAGPAMASIPTAGTSMQIYSNPVQAGWTNNSNRCLTGLTIVYEF